MVNLASAHWIIDLYGISQTVAEDPIRIGDFLSLVNARMFDYQGIVQLTPVLGDTAKPQNNGVSGLILFNGGHLTLHTFSQRKVAFMDWCETGPAGTADIERRKAILDSLTEAEIRYERCVWCRDNEAEGFGCHFMAEMQYLPLNLATKVIVDVMDAIKMTELARPIITLKGDNYSIIQPITESHIAIHAQKKGATLFDIFSCKNFDVDKVKQVFSMHNLSLGEECIVARGIYMQDKTL